MANSPAIVIMPYDGVLSLFAGNPRAAQALLYCRDDRFATGFFHVLLERDVKRFGDLKQNLGLVPKSKAVFRIPEARPKPSGRTVPLFSSSQERIEAA